MTEEVDLYQYLFRLNFRLVVNIVHLALPDVCDIETIPSIYADLHYKA